jgi:cation diffusion facilitator family transporter
MPRCWPALLFSGKRRGCGTANGRTPGHNPAVTLVDTSYHTARRVTRASIAVSGILACSNIIIGLLAQSTSVVATGFEFLGDVLASSIVLIGIGVAARPADENHPYGHGRFETLSAFVVGVILTAGGVMISYQSLQAVGARHPPPGVTAAAALAGAIILRGVMSSVKPVTEDNHS